MAEKNHLNKRYDPEQKLNCENCRLAFLQPLTLVSTTSHSTENLRIHSYTQTVAERKNEKIENMILFFHS